MVVKTTGSMVAMRTVATCVPRGTVTTRSCATESQKVWATDAATGG